MISFLLFSDLLATPHCHHLPRCPNCRKHHLHRKVSAPNSWQKTLQHKDKWTNTLKFVAVAALSQQSCVRSVVHLSLRDYWLIGTFWGTEKLTDRDSSGWCIEHTYWHLLCCRRHQDISIVQLPQQLAPLGHGCHLSGLGSLRLPDLHPPPQGAAHSGGSKR